MSNYNFTKEMREISGFGGGYEQTCRDMLKAGLEWWDAHPEKNPQFVGLKRVYRLIDEENKDAKELSEILLKAAKNDCTGAMHQAVVSHILWIHANSWEKFVTEMSQETVSPISQGIKSREGTGP